MLSFPIWGASMKLSDRSLKRSEADPNVVSSQLFGGRCERSPSRLIGQLDQVNWEFRFASRRGRGMIAHSSCSTFLSRKELGRANGREQNVRLFAWIAEADSSWPGGPQSRPVSIFDLIAL